MKHHVVFFISEGMIKFLQVSGMQKDLVAGMDIIDTANQEDAQISQNLNTFIKQRRLNFSECRVTVMIGRSEVILRHMVFPSQRPDEIHSMIDLQVGSYIPYSKEEVEIDFQILSKTADGFAKVAVVIIPQEIAMRYWNIFVNSKIPIRSLTISSIGLFSLFQQRPDLFDKPGAIFDLDVDRCEICLCDKNHWLISREIPIGFSQMQQDGYVEILKQWALTQNNVINEGLSGAVESVYIVSSKEQSCGLGTEMVKVQNSLRVKEISLMKTLSLARGVQWPKLMVDDGVSMASLAGIGFNPHKPLIDLVPQSVRKIQEERAYQRQLVILGMWVTAALILLVLALAMGFIWKNVQAAHLENQIRDTKSDAREAAGRLQKVYDIEGMIKSRLVFSDLARDIDQLLPGQIYLVHLTISDGHALSFEGMSPNSVAINQFQKAMLASQGFFNVSLDYVNKRPETQGEVYYFKITCTTSKNEKT